MKVSTKLFILIFAAVLLFIFSFLIDTYFNQTLQDHYLLQAKIRNFEISLLRTIVKEKEYNRLPDSGKSLKVLDGIDETLEILKTVEPYLMANQAEKDDYSLLKTGLQSYNQTFEQLALENESMRIMLDGVHRSFETFNEKSTKAKKTVNGVIGRAFMNSEETDTSYFSFNALNGSIKASFVELILTVNSDLLLRENGETFQKKYKTFLDSIQQEDKKLHNLAQYLKDDSLKKFTDDIHATIPYLKKSLNNIYELWVNNNLNVERLDVERESILDSTYAVSNKCDNMLTAIRKRINKIQIFAFLLTLLLLTSFGIYTKNSIVGPVIATVKRLKDIVEGEGDLTARLEIHGKDEMSELAKWFNRFAENQQTLFFEIVQNIETLNSSSLDLQNVSDRLVSGSEKMTSQAVNVADASSRMTGTIKTVANAAAEMSNNTHSVSSTAEELSLNMNSVASAIEETSMIMREMAETAQEGATMAEQADKMATSATATMNLLGKTASEIDQVTIAIKRIAEQTNLLALNATIEAAAAGDAGKGFAVVASEIKELAAQSSNAAEDIGKHIGGMQANTEEAVQVISSVSATITTLKKASIHIYQSVKEQTATANEISANVQQANSGVNNIASAIAEIADNTEEIANNAGKTAQDIHAVSQNTQGVSKAAAASNTEAQQVRKSAKDLTSVAGLLHQLIGKFKITDD